MVKGEGTRKITGRRGEHLREKLKKRGPSQQDRFFTENLPALSDNETCFYHDYTQSKRTRFLTCLAPSHSILATLSFDLLFDQKLAKNLCHSETPIHLAR